MILDFTKAAVADLQSIRSYTFHTWGVEQEQIYLDSLWKKFGDLLANPERWRRRNDLFPSCQIAAHSKHVILFRINGPELQIVRILHSAMDFPRHLTDEE